MVQHLPAYNPTVQKTNRYIVESRDPDRLYISASNVRLGTQAQLLDFDLQLLGVGYIGQLKPVTIFPLGAVDLERVGFVELVRSWSQSSESIILVDNSIFVPAPTTAVLSAVCRVPVDHVAGLLRWSLFYRPPDNQDDQEVIKGHDKDSPGICSFSNSGLFKEGEYTIIAQRFLSSGNLAAQDSRSWTLSSPSPQLSCGGYSDPSSPLCL
jgi:hypothetical protein